MFKPISVLGCALMLGGCITTPYSETPSATNFPTSSQEKLQAASHWNLISQDLFSKLQQQIAGKVNQPIYISADADSPFNQAVTAELITSFVNAGYQVMKSPENTLHIAIDTQVVKFSPDRLQARQVGTLSTLATGLWVLTEMNTRFSPAGVATGAIFGSEAAAYFNSDKASGATPQTEIMINVRLVNAQQYLAATRATYYVADNDTKLYQMTAAMATFDVRGDTNK